MGSKHSAQWEQNQSVYLFYSSQEFFFLMQKFSKEIELGNYQSTHDFGTKNFLNLPQAREGLFCPSFCPTF